MRIPPNLTKFQPQDQCPAYIENIVVQNGPNTEMVKYRNSEIFQKLRSDVSRRIGYPPYQTLSDQQVLNIYEMCRFDKAWFPETPSAWCAVSYNILKISV